MDFGWVDVLFFGIKLDAEIAASKGHLCIDRVFFFRNGHLVNRLAQSLKIAL